MIDPDGYAIRKATLQDIDDLTRLHCASFRPEEHVPMMLGETIRKGNLLVASWQQRCLYPGSRFGRENCRPDCSE